MAGVYVDWMKCKSSVDAADDIYMVVFRGGSVEPFKSRVGVVGPGDFWGDFDDDEVWNQDIFVAKYLLNNSYVVMLAERDADNDLLDNNQEHLALWRAQLGSVWQTYLTALKAASLSGNGPWPPSAQQLADASQQIVNAMHGLAGISFKWPIGDDDSIGWPQHLVVSVAKPKTLEFKGGGGDYMVKFKVK
jgi:hypothetical protein